LSVGASPTANGESLPSKGESKSDADLEFANEQKNQIHVEEQKCRWEKEKREGGRNHTTERTENKKDVTGRDGKKTKGQASLPRERGLVRVLGENGEGSRKVV